MVDLRSSGVRYSVLVMMRRVTNTPFLGRCFIFFKSNAKCFIQHYVMFTCGLFGLRTEHNTGCLDFTWLSDILRALDR